MVTNATTHFVISMVSLIRKLQMLLLVVTKVTDINWLL